MKQILIEWLLSDRQCPCVAVSRKSCHCGTDDLPVGPGGGWGRRSEQTVNKHINGELPENGARTPQILPVGYRARQSAPAEGVVTLPCLTCQAHGPGSSSETVGAPPPHRLWTRSSLHLKTLFSQIPTYPPLPRLPQVLNGTPPGTYSLST